MEFKVRPKEDFSKGLEGLGVGTLEEVTVEADDRWGAVVAASKIWGIEKLVKMQVMFDSTYVGKVKKSSVREWRVGTGEEGV